MSYYTYSYPSNVIWAREIPFFFQTSNNVQQRSMGPLMDKTKRSTVMPPPSLPAAPSNRKLPIRIVSLEAKIENRPTLIDEKSSAVLKYRTPHFRAQATLHFPPLDDDEHWKIGWIQACTQMDFFNSYGEWGYSSWEFPQLMSGQHSMISDADGQNYPFYGSKSELIELHGPSNDYRTVQVVMNDNFYPHITWDIPTSNERLVRLTHVKRDQSFYTWLVAMNARNGSILVLKTISWKMNLEIIVQPTKAQGSRATLISNPLPVQPEILKENIRIPTHVLYPPNANSAQILVWHPRSSLEKKSSRPEIVVPPRCVSILDENPFYNHYLRHKTPTSIQNKLNSGHSADQSSTKSYTRIIYPPVSNPSTSVQQCYHDMKHILKDHAKLAQGIVVR